jgi:hypothetical protein
MVMDVRNIKMFYVKSREIIYTFLFSNKKDLLLYLNYIE